MRPYWKGYLKLALVSCPIALHAACSTSERVAFRQINKVTGNRLRQQLVDEETREPVAPERFAPAVASGHAAAPPISVMNWRRLLTRSPRRRGQAVSAARQGRVCARFAH